MTERVLLTGNEAVGWAAIYAGCKFFFGYPITPQNSIPEFMSAELPKIGGTYLQSECELAAINMLYGAGCAGARAMVSTSSPGISLMSEGISGMAAAEIPGVVVDVVRMGPGWGTIQNGQTDYLHVTRGGGHGGQRCIVLAPSSPQETFDLMQMSFYLADKYRMVVIVLSDYMVGEMAEPVELSTLEFGPLPEKDWAAKGKGEKGGKRCRIATAFFDVISYHESQAEKYRKITETEVRYEAYKADDAELLLVAYGSSARMAERAVNMARAEGIRAGLFRPITLWPFPFGPLKQAGSRASNVLVVEDSQGQLVEDVKIAMERQAPVHLLGVWGRHMRDSAGLIHPERIFEEVRTLGCPARA